MVALDLDGTLLNSHHDLSDATVSHLRRLHSKGFLIAIATGRSAACAAGVIEKLDLLPSSTDNGAHGFPLVCTNGARGLRIRKSKSDIGHVTSSSTPNNRTGAAAPAPHRSSTVPLTNTPSSKNPFLQQTLIINQELFHNPLSPSLTRKTLALAHKLNCVTNYYHNHHIYAVVRNEDQLALTKRYGKLTGSTDLYCYLNEDKGDEKEAEKNEVYNESNAYGYQKAIELGPPSKLLILCETDELDKTTQLVREELNGIQQNKEQQNAHVIRGAPPFFVEILDPTVNKGHGLRQLCQSVGIPLEEVIAFGDGDNDLEFISMAGWGVAMKNAREVVKEAADEVTEWTNDEDGVIKMLQRYEGEGKLLFSNGSC